jgi:penicillin-binding protein 1C
MPLPEEMLHPTDRTLTLLDHAGHEIAVVPSTRARVADSIPLAAMGAWLPKVTVALEDRRFWSHDGIDLPALIGAGWRNVRFGRIVSGASTIAQQLIKATRGRSGSRCVDKLYEALAARRLVREWPREQILEEYLNRIDYGNRRIGPRAAAQAYFAKEPADLSAAEAIFLAGLPQAPSRHNPWTHPGAAIARYQRSVRVLRASGVIDATLAREAGAAPPLVARRIPPNAAPHFVAAINARSPGLRGRVSTTLDLELQRAIATLARDHVARLRGRGVGQAAVVVVDNRDGAVRALVGAADDEAPDHEINGALLPRSCGSVLKPFLYLNAIDQRRLTAASVLPDTPDAIHSVYVDYDPQNFDQRFLGPVRVREALGNSLNVPAVYALSRVGARPFFTHLADWGFGFPRDLREYGAGFILGNAELRLVDLAAAFAGIASGGRVPAWRLLESASWRRPRLRRSSPTSSAMTTRGDARSAAIPRWRCPCACPARPARARVSATPGPSARPRNTLWRCGREISMGVRWLRPAQSRPRRRCGAK